MVFFAPVFSRPVWNHVQLLMLGAILARGKRTVTSALRDIGRTTPFLFGLFSLVALMALRLVADGQLPVAQTAWYRKEQTTFSDVLAFV